MNVSVTQTKGQTRPPTVGAPNRGFRWALVAGGIAVLVGAVLSVWLLPHGVEVATAALLGCILVAVAVQPRWAIFVFVVGLPLHNLLMALLFKATGDATFVKLVQPWKEVVLAVALLRVVLPAAATWLRTRRLAPLRVTPLDVVVGLFVLLCAISVALPGSGVSLVGRLYGFRDLVVPLGALLLGRLIPPTSRELQVLLGLLALDVVAFAIGSIGERAFWGNGLLLAIDYGTYIRVFLGMKFPLPHNTPYTFYTAGYLPRAGSLAVGPLDVGILVMIALPVLVVALSAARQQGMRWAARALGLAALLAGVALVLAWGRESLVLIAFECVVLLMVLRPRVQWRGVALVLVGCALGAALLLSADAYVVRATSNLARVETANQGLVPLVIADQHGDLSGVLSRPATNAAGELWSAARELLGQSTSSHNASTVSHQTSLVRLTGNIFQRPLGYGIGASGQVGNRFHGDASLSGESAYLTVGVELGVIGLLLYLAMFGGAIFACWQLARSRLPRLQRTVYLGVGIAWLTIALDGVFTEVTLNLFAMYLLWFMTGAALTLVQLGRAVPVVEGDGAPLRWMAARPLRVAVDAQCLQTARTGVRTYIDELLKQFARPDAPHTVVPLRGPKRLPSNVRLFRMINQAMYLPWLHVWLPVRLWLGNFDVLFSPEYLTAAWTPVPRVVAFHDAMFLRRPQDYNPLWLLLVRWISLPALRRADAVIVPSRHAAQETAALARVRPERIHVVPLAGPTAGAPPREGEQVAAGALARYGVAPGKYVLHVGVLERRKNLPTLVKAFALWREQGGPADEKLVLVGQAGPRPDLDDSEHIRRTIAELGLAEQVVLAGHVPVAERDALYTRAAAVAVPSLLEGFGLPVLEAFAAGVPVVAARSTALPEVAGDGALLFDPASPQELADCLARLTDDAALRSALVRAGSERAREFTWERTARETLEVFEAAVVAARGPSAAAATQLQQAAQGMGERAMGDERARAVRL